MVARIGVIERALVETGASLSLIQVDRVKHLLGKFCVQDRLTFVVADGRRIQALGCLTLSTFWIKGGRSRLRSGCFRPPMFSYLG